MEQISGAHKKKLNIRETGRTGEGEELKEVYEGIGKVYAQIFIRGKGLLRETIVVKEESVGSIERRIAKRRVR